MIHKRVHLRTSPLGPVTSRGYLAGEPPAVLRAAFHRQAIGVWELVAPGERTPQADLWDVRIYDFAETVLHPEYVERPAGQPEEQQR